MVEFTFSNHVSKILSRYSKSPSPYSIEKSNLDSNQDSSIHQYTFSKDSSSSFQNLKSLCQTSVAKHSNPSLRSLTPSSLDQTLSTVKPRETSFSPSPGNPSVFSPKKDQNFQPKLNKNSMRIASKLGNCRERLMSNNPTQKDIIEEEEYRYKPEINKKSRKITKKQNNNEQRWNFLYNQGKEKKKELERIRSEIEIKEKKMEEFSFKPTVLDPSLNSDPCRTVERLASWAKSKEQKIRQRKETEMDKDLKECTFSPKLTQQQQSKEELKMVKGVSKFVERGQKIKNDSSQEVFVKNSPVKDMDRKKYNEIVQILHDELLSLDI